MVLINILTEINNKVTLMSEEILFLKDQIGLIKKRDKNEPTWLTEVVSAIFIFDNYIIIFCKFNYLF